MGFVVTVACVLVLQQLRVEPYPGEVGRPVTVTASRGNAPLAGLELSVESPGEQARTVGVTDTQGRWEHVPLAAGQHIVSATVDGVSVLAPYRVVPARRRWWQAMGTVPLGLAVLWVLLRQLSRARGRRDP